MNTVIFTTLFSVITVATGCAYATEDRRVGDPGVTAGGISDGKGKLKALAPTPDDIAKVKDARAKRDAVDRDFPPGVVPEGARRLKAKQMLKTGELILDDGRKITLDGVSCTPIGYQYLSRYFLDPDASLVVLETGQAVDGKTPAEVWVIESLEAGSIATVVPVESGLTTGWCSPKHSRTSPHNERFAALAEAFAVERKAYAEMAP